MVPPGTTALPFDTPPRSTRSNVALAMLDLTFNTHSVGTFLFSDSRWPQHRVSAAACSHRPGHRLRIDGGHQPRPRRVHDARGLCHLRGAVGLQAHGWCDLRIVFPGLAGSCLHRDGPRRSAAGKNIDQKTLWTASRNTACDLGCQPNSHPVDSQRVDCNDAWHHCGRRAWISLVQVTCGQVLRKAFLHLSQWTGMGYRHRHRPGRSQPL